MTGYEATLRELLKRTMAPAEFGEVTYKPVFGAAGGYIDGNIFASCGNFGLALKLPARTRERLMAESGAQPLRYFAKGHVKRDYVVLSERILAAPDLLSQLVQESVTFVSN